MTAPIVEEPTRITSDEKSLKVNARHSPARPSSLPDDATLTPQSLSPHNSTIGPSHASFSYHGELPSSKSGHVAALRSPGMEPSGSQGWETRSPTSTKHEETSTKHEMDAGNQDPTDLEPSKKRRIDETDDVEPTETEAYEELRRSAFQALQSIEQDFAKLRER
jgi:hypothetical protein